MSLPRAATTPRRDALERAMNDQNAILRAALVLQDLSYKGGTRDQQTIANRAVKAADLRLRMARVRTEDQNRGR